jgi:hypothetical protein
MGLASNGCTDKRNYWSLCGRPQPEECSKVVGLIAQALSAVCRYLHRQLGGLSGCVASEAASGSQ